MNPKRGSCAPGLDSWADTTAILTSPTLSSSTLSLSLYKAILVANEVNSYMYVACSHSSHNALHFPSILSDNLLKKGGRSEAYHTTTRDGSTVCAVTTKESSSWLLVCTMDEVL